MRTHDNNLLSQCSSIHWGPASDDDDESLFTSSDVIEHPQDGILLIKYNDPRSTLLTLRLDDVTNRVWHRLCYILRQNTSLGNLSISGRPSSGNAADRPVSVFWACVGIQTNTSIKELSMRDIRLGGPTQLNILADFLGGNPRLERLTLNRCHLGPGDIDCLSDQLMRRSTHTLEKLDLSGSLVGVNALDSLVQALINMRSVKHLNLGSNDIGEGGGSIISLARLLRSRSSTIEELDITNNSLRVDSVLYLLNSLRKNTRLKRLDLNDNPMTDEDWSVILGCVLQLVYDNSRNTQNVVNSNHTLSTLGSHRGDPSQLRRRRRFRRYPMEEVFNRCLGEDQAQFLNASFGLNYRTESVAYKARHKILWSHTRGDFNVGEDPTIDVGYMPRILAWIGNGDSQCELCHKAGASLLQFQEKTPPRPVLSTIRLGAIYRILQARPELCSQLDELRFCQRELAHVQNKNSTLELELERLTREMELVHVQSRNSTLQLELERVPRKISPHHDAHIMSMMDKIRGLLCINAELFGRSLGSMEEVCNGMEENCQTTLSRFGFDVVRVHMGQSVQFTTEVNCSTRTFDLNPLSKLPPDLEDFLIIQYKSPPFSKFINIDAILKIVLMFREDVLEAVLPKLMDHLEAIRVCLGEIDKWIKKPNMNRNFIETTFGIKLDAPSKADYVGGACACVPGSHRGHHKSYICLQCQGPLLYHKEGRCPKGNTSFQCRKSYILKTINTPNVSLLSESGHKSKRTFEIGKKNEQVRLKKNLDFMSRLGVCLGEIDECLGKPNIKPSRKPKMNQPTRKPKVDQNLRKPKMDHQNLIDTTIGIKLKPRAEFVGGSCACLPGSQSRPCICLQCQCPLRNHKEGRCPKGNTFFQCRMSSSSCDPRKRNESYARSSKLIKPPSDTIKGDMHSDTQSLETGVVTEASTLNTEDSVLDVKQPHQRQGRFWRHLPKSRWVKPAMVRRKM